VGQWGLWSHPFLAATLVVRRVVSVTVDDNAQIGVAVSRILYGDGRITVECGVDVRIAIQVNELDLELLIHPRVVGRRSFFGSKPDVA
jgi:hypothetical protein